MTDLVLPGICPLQPSLQQYVEVDDLASPAPLPTTSGGGIGSTRTVRQLPTRTGGTLSTEKLPSVPTPTESPLRLDVVQGTLGLLTSAPFRRPSPSIPPSPSRGLLDEVAELSR